MKSDNEHKRDLKILLFIFGVMLSMFGAGCLSYVFANRELIMVPWGHVVFISLIVFNLYLTRYKEEFSSGFLIGLGLWYISYLTGLWSIYDPVGRGLLPRLFP